MSKIIDYLLKSGSIGSFLVSLCYQFIDGKWYGVGILSAYLRTHNADYLGGTRPKIADTLYSSIGSQSLTESFSGVSVYALLISLLLVFFLFAHVFYKPESQNPAPADYAVNGGKRAWQIAWHCQVAYRRQYLLITFVGFAALLGAFLILKGAFVEAELFLLISAPIAVYLFLYSSLAQRGDFANRFVYFSLFIFLVITLLGWPIVYGSRIYKPRFGVAQISGAVQDHCGGDLQRGPIFVADYDAKESVLFRLCFNSTGFLYLDFFTYPGEPPSSGNASFSETVQAFVGVVPQQQAGNLDALRQQIVTQAKAQR